MRMKATTTTTTKKTKTKNMQSIIARKTCTYILCYINKFKSNISLLINEYLYIYIYIYIIIIIIIIIETNKPSKYIFIL